MSDLSDTVDSFHLAIARATKSKAIEAVMDELLKITRSGALG